MDLFRQDVRYAIRLLRRGVGFSAVVVATLALGIGGTTAVFSFINSALLRPLPVEHPERLIWLSMRTVEGRTAMSFAHPEYQALREGARSLEGVAAFGMEPFRVDLDGSGATTLVGAVASDDYFSVLGVRPSRGGVWEPGSGASVVVSDALWRTRLGADPGIVGRTLRVGDVPATVVGVAPPGFGGTISLVGLDLWMPFETRALLSPGEDRRRPEHAWLQVVARLGDGVQPEAARAELGAVAQRESFGAAYGRRVEAVQVEPLAGLNGEGRTGALRASTLLLLIALLVLGIACVNIAGMLLARNAQRRGEMAVRAALGAGSGRLLRQLLSETLVLWTLGGAAGLGVALALGRLFPAVAPVPASFPARIGLHLGLDWRVLGFAAAATLLSGVGFGLLSALRASRTDLTLCLKEQGGHAPGRSRFRGFLTAAQVAASLLLLVCAGLLLRGLREISGHDPGYDPDGVSALPVELRQPGSDPPQPFRLAAFQAELLRRVGAEGEVRSAALASAVPGLAGSSTTRLSVDGRIGSVDVPLEFEVGYYAVSPEFFQTMRLPLLAGRGLSDRDRFGGAPVAVVSAEMARRFWPGEDPLGKTVRQGRLVLEVVGVAADVVPVAGAAGRHPTLYVALAQQPTARFLVLSRTRGEVLPRLAAAVRAADPAAVVEEPWWVRERIVSAVPHRVLAPVVGAFGLLALGLSMVGVYGMVSLFVAHRTREFGIRTALGADPREIAVLVLRRGFLLVLGGVGAGLPLSLAAARLLPTVMGGAPRFDVLTFAGVLLVLSAATLAASLRPALRVVRSDPMLALRAD